MFIDKDSRKLYSIQDLTIEDLDLIHDSISAYAQHHLGNISTEKKSIIWILIKNL